MSFPGMEVTEQPTVPQNFLLGEGCGVCLFPGFRDLLQSPRLFKEVLASHLSTPWSRACPAALNAP